MDETTWARLPEELMVIILSRLTIPILTRLKVVSKQWNSLISCTNSTFQRLVTKVAVSVTPAFLIELRYVSFWNRPMTIFTTTLWIVEGRNCKIYRVPVDFLPCPVNIIAVCKSVVLCCKHNGVKQFPGMYVCNPIIRTWKQLPSPNCLKWWDFVALAFDSADKRCRILIGRGSIKGDRETEMQIEMYDSIPNSWTKLHICTCTERVCPRGEGIYSRGRFYWINATDYRTINGDVVVLSVEDGSWKIIERPRDVVQVNREDQVSWCLGGVEGRLMLVCKGKNFCMWRLKEECGDESRKKMRKWVVEIRSSESWHEAVVNESGWSLVYLAKKNGMVIFDEKGKAVCRIDKREAMKLKMIAEDGTWPACVRSFQTNNIWWP